MYKKKSVFWLVVWGVLLIIGSLYSGINEIFHYFNTGTYHEYPPFAGYQLFLLLVFLPLILIPVLGLSHYYARKAKDKIIHIITACLIIQHIICLVSVVLQLI